MKDEISSSAKLSEQFPLQRLYMLFGWLTTMSLHIVLANKQQKQKIYHLPMWVKFEDNESKKKKLENAPKIRNKKHAVIEEYNHEWVFIVLDRTKMECKTNLSIQLDSAKAVAIRRNYEHVSLKTQFQCSRSEYKLVFFILLARTW